jgi:predicted component of type VI protein secretion system
MADRAADLVDGAASPAPSFAAANSGLRFDLVRTGDAAAPFVVLHEGHSGRVLLGSVHGHGDAIARFAWKLRVDPVRAPGRGLPPRNADADAAWQRERAELARVTAPQLAAPFVPAMALQDTPPLWWCRRVDRFFHPVSPASGRVLRTCRDDTVLAAAGLPAYADDHVRHLHGGAGERTLYRRAADGPVAGGAVHDEAQLVRGWAALVAAPDAPAAQHAAAALPCVQCPHRAQCYAVGSGAAGPDSVAAEREFVAVSFHDVDAVATTFAPLGCDQGTALLGGAALDDLLATAAPARAQALPADVAAALRSGPQWLFAGEPRRWQLEVLRQKLAVFAEVTAALAAVHATGRPHLGLCAQNVVFALAGATGAGGGGAPVRWSLQPRLLDLGSAEVVGRADDGTPLLHVGAEMLDDVRHRLFLPVLLRGPDVAALTLPVACYRAGEVDGKVRFVVEANGSSVPRTHRAGDAVVVLPANGGPSLVLRLEEMRPRGLLASTLLHADDPALGLDGTTFDARVVLHRRFGSAADLHGLGTLLLQLLLVDDEQGLDEVAETFARCLRRLEDEPTAVRLEERSLAARWRQLLAGRDARPRTDALHLLHRRSDRDALAAAIGNDGPLLDDGLWQRVLLLAARLSSTLPHFGFATSHGDGGPDLLAVVADELQAIQRRLHVALFAAAERDQAIAAVADAQLAALAQSAADGPGGQRGGFRLVVKKQGESTVQEHRFTESRVTIGRREGDNVLRLNDAMVSSAHAVIEQLPEGWCVMDRNSTNGTEVDGIRLPGEVPQPLQDGSVIQIRPFQLVFHGAEQRLDVTSFGPQLGAEELWEQLHDTFAQGAQTGAVAQRQALQHTLQQAQQSLGPTQLQQVLELLAPRWRQAIGGTAVGDVDATALAAASSRALAQLSRSLLGSGEFASPADVQAFVAKLGRFVETTSQWIERTLELRKALGKHLDLGFASTSAGRFVPRSAADVRLATLGQDGADVAGLAAGDGANLLARFYDELMSILEGLLQGNQQMRAAVRERLDPARLVDAVSKEAKLRLLVQATASSALWKAYVQAYHEVTDGGGYEAELDQLLQKAVQERAARGTA